MNHSNLTNSVSILRMGVIGCGHWGPNHVRVFSHNKRSEVLMCADMQDDKLSRMAALYPGVELTRDYQDVIENPDVDAVVIATPTNTHSKIIREALESGKHVLVEKPMCTQYEDAIELFKLSHTYNRVLMVGHVFLFNDGIKKLSNIIREGKLGDIHYMDAVRTNLGPIRGDVNAMYDLGTHDLSVFNYLLGSTPIEVSATGRCISQKDLEDVCFVTLRYPDNKIGHIHVSWMNPRKERTITVVGEQRMAHWNDIDADNTLRVYDKGVDEPPHYDSFGQFQYLLRNADVHIPNIKLNEPLENQANAFLGCVLDNDKNISDPEFSIGIISTLEAASESLKLQGAPVRVKQFVPDNVSSTENFML